MSEATAERRPHYLNVNYGLKSWLLTTDHKRIAWLYLLSVTFFFFIGGLFAMLIRLELLTPQGDLVQAETYNKLFTMHGVTMIFFFLIPSIPAVLGNFLIPIMIGARDLAFPRLNLASWYIYVLGGHLYADRGGGGRRRHRLDFLHTVQQHLFQYPCCAHRRWHIHHRIFIDSYRPQLYRNDSHHARAGHDLVPDAIVRLGALCHQHHFYLRHSGHRHHTCVGSSGAAFWPGDFQSRTGRRSIIVPTSFLVLLPSGGLHYDPAGDGGYQRVDYLFFPQANFRLRFVAFSSLAIAVLGFLVWGHHMFVSGQSVYASMIFSLLSMLVAIPSAVKVFNWTATLYKGSISLDAPMLYALGFIGLFTIGGLTGLFLATLGVDVHVHDTYFVIAHFHYIMVGSAVMAYLGGVHFWWPKMTGRKYPERLARLAAVIIFLGFNLTFFPQFVLGYLGMPRRYHVYPPEFQVLNVLSTAGASILGVGYVLPLVYLIWSLRYGAIAGMNPWKARGLEWQTPSPPPTNNFAVTPTVVCDAYAYESVEPEITYPAGRPADV